MKARAFILFGVLVWAQAARADVFAILPPWQQGADGPKASLQIARLIEADLAQQNAKVMTPEQTVSHVPSAERVVCDSGECVERYRTAALATAAIVVRVYRAEDGPGPATSFQIAIQPKLGVEYARGDVFGSGPREDAVRRVFRDVLAAYRNPGPWLQVLGEPKGADVYLDERRVGVLPWTDRVSVGMHQLRVEAAGFEPQFRLVPLAAPGASVEEKFLLEPARMKVEAGTQPALRTETYASALAMPPPTPQLRAGIALIVLGAPAMVAGAAWLGLGIHDHNQHDACLRSDTELRTCFRERKSASSDLAIAGGSTAAAFGLVSLVAGTWLYAHGRAASLQADAGPGRFSMRLRKEF